MSSITCKSPIIYKAPMKRRLKVIQCKLAHCKIKAGSDEKEIESPLSLFLNLHTPASAPMKRRLKVSSPPSREEN